MRTLAGVLIATVIMGPAVAAPPPSVWTWTGFYVGANAGYSWGRDHGPITLGNSFSDQHSTSLDGFIGGGQFGYNWQASNWVYGLEADFQGTGQKGSANAVCPGGASQTSVNGLCTPGHVGDTVPNSNPAFPVTASLSEKLEWLGTFRGRIGTTITPTLLPYVTGGLAYGHIKVSEAVGTTNVFGTPSANDGTFAPGGGTFNKGTTKVGWTVGAGLESMLWGNWTGKIEYLYVDLGTVSGSFSTSVVALNGSSLVAGYSSHVTDNIVRVGLNYAFH